MTDVLTGLALVVVLSVAARLLASVLRMPAIVPLLVAGAVAGGVTGLIDPRELLGDALTPIVSIAVGIILFEGALNLRWSDLGDGVRGVVTRLITIGVLVTWLASTAAVLLLLDLPTELALLIGAILIVSGPTVVMPMLDFIRPARSVRSVLRWEGILIDPIGAVIAVVVFGGLAYSSEGAGFGTGEFGLTVLAGGGVGALAGVILIGLLGSGRLSGRDQVAAGLMMVVAAFAAAEFLYEDAGLTATIVTGLVLANQRRVPIGRLVEFSETLVPLLIGVLFILLAANVDLDAVVDLGLPGLALVAVIVCLVRPLAALVSTVGSPFGWRERAFIAAMAPRGIVAASTASVFGLQLTEAGVPGAEQIVPVSFLVIAGTVFIYALGAPALARALGVASVAAPRLLIVGAPGWALRLGRAMAEHGVDVRVWAQSDTEAAAIAAAGLEEAPDPMLGDENVEDELIEGISAVLLVSEDDAFNHVMAAAFTDRLDPDQVYVKPPRPGARQAVATGVKRLALDWHDLGSGPPGAESHLGGEAMRVVEAAELRAEQMISLASITFGRGSRPARIQISTELRSTAVRARGRVWRRSCGAGDLHVAVSKQPGDRM